MSGEDDSKEYFDKDKCTKHISISDIIPRKEIEVKQEPIDSDINLDQKQTFDLKQYENEKLSFNENIDSEGVRIGDSIIMKKEPESCIDYNDFIKIEETKINQFEYLSLTTIDQNADNKAPVQKSIKNFNCTIERNLSDEEIVNGDSTYNCLRCEYKSNSGHNYKLHLKTHNATGIFICNICGKQFKRKSNLLRHAVIHSEEKLFKCHLCDYTGKLQERVQRHIQRMHKTKYKHQTGNNIKTHLNEDDNLFDGTLNKNSTQEKKIKNLYCEKIMKYQCPKCSYRTDRSNYLRMHLEKNLLCSEKEHKCSNIKHRDEEDYVCSKCNYKTNDEHCFKRHFAIHEVVKSYECEICDKQFNRKNQLKGHNLIHSEDKKYHCAHCDFKSNSRKYFVAHLQDKHLQVNKREYKCPNCPYQTNRSSSFKKHFKIHLVDKQFKCSECIYQTDSKRNLNRHLYIHHTIKPLDCSMCDQSFKRKDHLEHHIIRKHIDKN